MDSHNTAEWIGWKTIAMDYSPREPTYIPLPCLTHGVSWCLCPELATGCPWIFWSSLWKQKCSDCIHNVVYVAFVHSKLQSFHDQNTTLSYKKKTIFLHGV